MKSSRGGQEGQFDFISDFFDEVIGVISGFFKWVTELFSGPFGEDSKKSNTQIKREEGGETEENSPQNLLFKIESVGDPINDQTNMSKSVQFNKLEQSFMSGEISFVENSGNPKKYILNLAPELNKSLFRNQSSGELSQTQQSESILNESSISEELSQEGVARVFCDIFTNYSERYSDINDFIDNFAGGFIQRQYGTWLPDKIREVEKTQIFPEPTSSPFVRFPSLLADKESSPSSEGKTGGTPRL